MSMYLDMIIYSIAETIAILANLANKTFGGEKFGEWPNNAKWS